MQSRTVPSTVDLRFFSCDTATLNPKSAIFMHADPFFNPTSMLSALKCVKNSILLVLDISMDQMLVMHVL
jgi:hypothetical protein